MSKQPDNKFNYMRFAGAGLELAGSMIVPAAIGYALDRYLIWSTPWFFLAGEFSGSRRACITSSAWQLNITADAA
ncbi:MAG: AtpZ/AtpI family protein [Pirellulaceae bacterium]